MVGVSPIACLPTSLPPRLSVHSLRRPLPVPRVYSPSPRAYLIVWSAWRAHRLGSIFPATPHVHRLSFSLVRSPSLSGLCTCTVRGRRRMHAAQSNSELCTEFTCMCICVWGTTLQRAAIRETYPRPTIMYVFSNLIRISKKSPPTPQLSKRHHDNTIHFLFIQLQPPRTGLPPNHPALINLRSNPPPQPSNTQNHQNINNKQSTPPTFNHYFPNNIKLNSSSMQPCSDVYIIFIFIAYTETESV